MTFVKLSLTFLFILPALCWSRSFESYQKESSKNDSISQEDVMKYLQKYNYLDKKENEDSAAYVDISAALKQLQKSAGIEETGKLDEQTKQLILTPRCGNTNVNVSLSEDFRVATKWGITRLSYNIVNYPTRTYNIRYASQIRYFVQRAFNYWSDVSTLTFFRTTSSRANIKIRFYRGNHGDSAPFDGIGNTLAHAFFPTEGEIHFDDDESWSSTGVGGPNFMQVMVHEIGHALGLRHTTYSSAVMYAFYTYKPRFSLHFDDIRGIRYLYGSNTGVTTRMTTTTTRANNNYVRIYRPTWNSIKSQVISLYNMVRNIY